MKFIEDITEQEEERRGELIASELRLKKNKKGRYNLQSFGDKTAIGFYRTMKRLVLDGE